MGIQKQEFYEGAALHLLIRGGSGSCIRYEAPFFVLNERILLLMKYSTAGRSPWGFTFAPEEQALLSERAAKHLVVLGLVCGSDSVAAVRYELFSSMVGADRTSSIRIGCARKHREYFEIRGPRGAISEKIPPSDWQRLGKL